PRPVTVYNYHPSELIVRMLRGTCEFCGSHGNTVKVHHVAALKDLKPEKPWEAKMLSMRRKSLVVCDHCFALIQSDM
ncbi:MAG: group II intron reverse transcriptase/maturase, partial [Candidatus Ventricola sp.]|nr:group II intron reverse transcriptase/maturase [Candidatus Ventricola sp.]